MDGWMGRISEMRDLEKNLVGGLKFEKEKQM